jgi:hypothetical protein
MGDPMIDQSLMKKSLGSFQEACPLIMQWGSMGDRPPSEEEEMNLSTTYWRTIPFLDLQKYLSPLPEDLKVNYHHHLSTTHQVWQGPQHWAVRTQNLIRSMS